MSNNKRLAGKLGGVVGSVLLAYATFGQPSATVEVNVRLPALEIHATSDFYEPLSSQGEWVTIGSYGRCWRPARVEAGWRPYCNGSWQRTDAGWYWVSDEPWAWATYHYGRWDFTTQYGWYWVPQMQWAPAWVSWHEGGGYIGWAPLQPSARISGGDSVEVNVKLIAPGAFIFVEQRHFLEPIRPTTVVVDNIVILNKTANITNIKVVNNTVINEGPATAAIEKASGRKIQALPVQEMRHHGEAAVVAQRKTPTATGERLVQPPAHSEAIARENKTLAPHGPPPIQKASDKNVRRPIEQKPAANEKSTPNTAEKDHQDKPKE